MATNEATASNETDMKEQEGDAEATSATDAKSATAQDPTMSAFILGYTGEVGKELVKQLAREKVFKKIVLIGRRKVEYKDEAISNNTTIEQVLVNFDELEQSKDVFQGLDVGFCCLGTLRSKAGKKGQWKVDHDYPVKTAELAKEGGCKQYHLVSSLGAKSNSMVFYNKLKGQTEDDVKAVGIERTSIYRPGGLMCDREEFRFGEWIARKSLAPVDYFFPGVITNATSIVAKAMINNVSKNIDTPSEILESKAIHKMGTQ